MTPDPTQARERLKRVATYVLTHVLHFALRAIYGRSAPNSKFAADLRAILAENEAMRDALEPFAATGAVLDVKPKDSAVWAGQTPAPPITFGHLRRAAALRDPQHPELGSEKSESNP